MSRRPERKQAESFELQRAESFELPRAVLRRRAASARVRRRRMLLADAGIALAIVLIALIAGVGVALLGVIAGLALIVLGVARLCLSAYATRLGRRARDVPRRR